MKTYHSSQRDTFKAFVRELGADEDAKHWDDRLRKLAKFKPYPERLK